MFNQSNIRLLTIGCSICVIACLFPANGVEAGRLQDFIQSIVGGNSNSNSNNSNKETSNQNSNSNSNSNSDSTESDVSSSNDSTDQQLTPMMSAMNPFMRYPSF